ncbi:hypothetical protein M1D88_04915 [Arthrobacter sp. R1-13]
MGETLTQGQVTNTDIANSDSEDDQPSGRAMEPLGPWPRWFLGVGGAASGASGAVGVFVPDTNGVGVILLLLLGGAFIYVAASGQRLMQLDKDGFKLAAVTQRRVEALENVITQTVSDRSVPEEAVDRIVQAVDEIATAKSFENERDFQFHVELQLRQFSRRYGFDVAVEPPIPFSEGVPLRPDFVLESSSKHLRVPLELKAPRQASSAFMRQSIQQVVRYKDACRSQQAVLLITSPVTHEQQERALEQGVILLSCMSDDEIFSVVKRALTKLGFVPGEIQGP